MTRNWITSASLIVRMVQPGSVRRQRRSASLRVENLEHRLSLSTFAGGAVVADLNPQPLPPRRFALFVEQGPASLDLNPQPLPPGFMVIGNHIGTS
jgi:hypothetical protein